MERTCLSLALFGKPHLIFSNILFRKEGTLDYVRPHMNVACNRSPTQTVEPNGPQRPLNGAAERAIREPKENILRNIATLSSGGGPSSDSVSASIKAGIEIRKQNKETERIKKEVSQMKQRFNAWVDEEVIAMRARGEADQVIAEVAHTDDVTLIMSKQKRNSHLRGKS